MLLASFVLFYYLSQLRGIHLTYYAQWSTADARRGPAGIRRPKVSLVCQGPKG